MIIGLVISLLWILFDQGTKIWAMSALPGQPPQSVLGSFLQFTYVENTGAAFGILQNHRFFFILLTIAIVLALLYFLWRYHRHSLLFDLSLGLILGGAIGNLADRLRLGFVVDFIRVDFFSAFDFPVFNVADIGVSVGIVLLVAILIFTSDEKWEAIDERAHRK